MCSETNPQLDYGFKYHNLKWYVYIHMFTISTARFNYKTGLNSALKVSGSLTASFLDSLKTNSATTPWFALRSGYSDSNESCLFRHDRDAGCAHARTRDSSRFRLGRS